MWRGTPYRHDTCQPSFGVDCINFAVAVLDWLHQFDPTQLPTVPSLPEQAPFTSAAGWTFIKFVVDRYGLDCIWNKNCHEISELSPLPGDVLCVSYDPHPCHAMVAGPRRNVLWHAMPNRGGSDGVVSTGLGWALEKGLSRVWRSPLL